MRGIPAAMLLYRGRGAGRPWCVCVCVCVSVCVCVCACVQVDLLGTPTPATWPVSTQCMLQAVWIASCHPVLWREHVTKQQPVHTVASHRLFCRTPACLILCLLLYRTGLSHAPWALCICICVVSSSVQGMSDLPHGSMFKLPDQPRCKLHTLTDPHTSTHSQPSRATGLAAGHRQEDTALNPPISTTTVPGMSQTDTTATKTVASSITGPDLQAIARDHDLQAAAAAATGPDRGHVTDLARVRDLDHRVGLTATGIRDMTAGAMREYVAGRQHMGMRAGVTDSV